MLRSAPERAVHHDAWHRIADATIRLRAGVHTVRQRTRGRVWHVVEDAAANRYARISESAWAFVGLLDGARTVAQARSAAEQRLGDAAPTKAEAVALLAQLGHAGLLAGDGAPDAEALARASGKQRAREFRGRLASFLFVRIPLVDPDPLLSAWAPVIRPVYSRPALALWLAFIIYAAVQLVPVLPALRSGAAEVLAPSNIPLLILVFVATKLIHELGHGFACKAMAAAEHDRTREETRGSASAAGEVHQLGIMLLVLFPVPYVETSSAWNIRSPFRRALVNAAGMHAELFVAAIAAIAFASTTPGSPINDLARNTVLIAGITTVLFNANPLLRYDGYYILSDLTGTPNLASRSRETVLALIRRFGFGVRAAHDTAHSSGERAWLLSFGLASGVYRLLVAAAIVWFVSGQLLVVGLLLAIAAIGTLVVMPLSLAARYLLTSNELRGRRHRAIALTTLTGAVLAVAIGIVPVPDTATLPGVVEAANRSPVTAAATGRVNFIAEHGSLVKPGDPIVRMENPDLIAEAQRLSARLDEERVRHRIALRDRRAAAAAVALERVNALERALGETESRVSALSINADRHAIWLSRDAHRLTGTRVPRGEPLGELADPEQRVVRAVAAQTAPGELEAASAERPAIVSSNGRPSLRIPARSVRAGPSATTTLPSASLTYHHGGPIRPANPIDPDAALAAEPVFPVFVDIGRNQNLRVGERVWVRFRFTDKPLLEQGSRALAQLVQRRETEPR